MSTRVCARTHTHPALHELHHINYKLYTHDTWSVRGFGVGTPSACALWVHVDQLKQRNKPASPPCLKVHAAFVSFSWTPGYFSVQAIVRCVFINITHDEMQSSICWWGCLSGKRIALFRPQAVWKSNMMFDGKLVYIRTFRILSSRKLVLFWHCPFLTTGPTETVLI